MTDDTEIAKYMADRERQLEAEDQLRTKLKPLLGVSSDDLETIAYMIAIKLIASEIDPSDVEFEVNRADGRMHISWGDEEVSFDE